MATDKLFKVVGISKREGEYKIRFANDIMRIKVLAKGGHEDIRLVELDEPMSKMEAVVAIKGMDEFQDVVAQATIVEYVERNTPRAKAESTPTATKKSVVTKTTKVEDLEDAPF